MRPTLPGVKNGKDVYQINFLEKVFLDSPVLHMSFTLTLEKSLKPRDKSMAVNCESYYMTWKCVTTYTGVYWIWEIISLKALFKVKLSWQMQSFKCIHFRRDGNPRRNSTPRSARPNDPLSAYRIFTDTSFQFLFFIFLVGILPLGIKFILLRGRFDNIWFIYWSRRCRRMICIK